MKLNKQTLFGAIQPILRIALGVVFIWAGIQKIQHPHSFLSSVASYELVEQKFALIVAVTLPWIELFLGALLISGVYTGGALLGAAGLTAVFVFAQSSAMARGLTISCGCFGDDAPSLVGPATLARTGLLLAAALAAFAWPLFTRRRSALEETSAPA